MLMHIRDAEFKLIQAIITKLVVNRLFAHQPTNVASVWSLFRMGEISTVKCSIEELKRRFEQVPKKSQNPVNDSKSGAIKKKLSHPQLPPKPVILNRVEQTRKNICHNKVLLKLNRKEAEQKLSNVSQDGSYVLRQSDDSKYAAKAVVVVNKCLYHFHIRQKDNNKVCLGMIEKTGEHNFDSLDQLIDYYTTHQIVLVNRTGHRQLAVLSQRIV